MAFKFKRTIYAPQVSVSLTPREWEVVRKVLHLQGPTFRALPLYAIIGAASHGEFLESLDDYASFLKGGTQTADVEVKVGDEVLYDGEWLPVVALSRNGEEVVVDGGEGGVYVLMQAGVEDHRPTQGAPQPAQEAPVEKYVPKVGDRVRATSTANNVNAAVLGKVGVICELSSCERIGVQYEGRPAGSRVWWLKDFEPAQIVGKEYIHETFGRCTLIRNDGDCLPIVTVHSTGRNLAVPVFTLTPA